MTTIPHISLLQCDKKLDITKETFIEYANALKYLGYDDEQVHAFIFSKYDPLDIVGFKKEENIGYQLTFCGQTVIRNDHHEAYEEYMVSELILLSKLNQIIPDSILEKLKEKSSIEERIQLKKQSLDAKLSKYKKDLLVSIINREFNSLGLLDSRAMQQSIQEGMDAISSLNSINKNK